MTDSAGDFARWVRFVRESVLRISQEELARRSGLSTSTIQEIEDAASGRRRNQGTLAMLARGLGRSPERVKDAYEGKIEEEGGTNYAVDVVGGERCRMADDTDALLVLPRSADAGHEHLGATVGDASMSPRFEPGDLVAFRAGGQVESGRVHWLKLRGSPGTLRRVIERGEELELIPQNPAFDRSFVSRSDVERIGRVVFATREIP